MSDPANTTPPQSNAAPLLALLGGVLLFVSPFLTWFTDVGSAWEVFEFVDIALLATAGVVIVVCTARLLAVSGPPIRSRLLAAGAVGTLLVVASITEPPPTALEADEAFGAWLALFGAVVILAAGALDLARLSINVSVSAQRETPSEEERPDARPSFPPPPPPAPTHAPPPPPQAAAPREPALFRPEQPTPPVTPGDVDRFPPPPRRDDNPA